MFNFNRAVSLFQRCLYAKLVSTWFSAPFTYQNYMTEPTHLDNLKASSLEKKYYTLA